MLKHIRPVRSHGARRRRDLRRLARQMDERVASDPVPPALIEAVLSGVIK
jgi:hypothetical protein